MRIASSDVNLSSTHLAAERSTRQERLRQWVGDRRPNFEALERDDRGGRDRRAPGLADGIDDGPERRSLAARRVAGIARRLEAAANAGPTSGEPPAADAPVRPSDEETLSGDPRLLRIKLLVEALTGRKIKVLSMDDLEGAAARAEAAAADVAAAGANAGPQQPQRAGWGLEYELHETYDEVERTTFSAQGVVKTADGKEISFSYDLALERSFHTETHLNVRAGDALLKDPLVINFGGTAAQLTDPAFAFDLDADGTTEKIAWVQPGSGFLALDRNGNGSIDDGSELFGAISGDGFADLAAYDDDQNGWIDEADAVYDRLQVWTKVGSDDQLASLQERNVGAISLARQATPFAIKDADNALQGAIRASGIYVKEDGSGVGSVQQIDLAV